MKEQFKIKIVPLQWGTIALSIWGLIFFLPLIASRIESTFLYMFSIGIFSLVVGVAQHHLVFLGHDGSHGLATENNNLNDFLTQWVIFVPFLINLDNYRKFHDVHHVYVGGENDTELPLKEFSKEKYVSPQKATGLLLNCVKDLLMAGLFEMNNFILQVMKGKVIKVISSAIIWWLVVGSLLYFSGILVEFLLIWFIGLLTMFWASFRLRIYFEHYGLDILSQNKSDEVTHRIDFVKRLGWFRVLAMYWGQFHWEHHHNPGVPIYQLAEYRSFLSQQNIGPEVVVVTNPVKFLDSI